MGRALFYAIPAFIALAAGYQAVQTVFSCAGRTGGDPGCLPGGYFWLTLAALFVLLWIAVQTAFARRRGRKEQGGKGPGKGPEKGPMGGEGLGA